MVIPAFNAAANIAQTLTDVIAALTARKTRFEVLVIDDGSTDATVSEARRGAACAASESTVRVMSLGSNQGKGAAVRAGMLSSTLEWALFLDADHSTSINHVDLLWPAADRGCDVIIGSRRMPESTVQSARPTNRKLLGDVFPQLTRRLCLPDITDTQCGFKAFKRWTVRPVFEDLQTSRFAFDVEALVRARHLGASIGQIPVAWDNPAASTLRWTTDGPAMLRDVLAVSWRLRAGGSLAESLRATGARARHAESAAGVQPLQVEVKVPERLEVRVPPVHRGVGTT